MRHIFRSLALTMLLTLVVLHASALSYGLYICGKQVEGNDSTFNVTEDGKIKYDPLTRTLTLRDVVLRDTLCAIHNARIDGLTILVEGTDSIFTTGADGLLLERRTVIRSTGHDGLLCISTGKAKDATVANEAALRVTGGSTLLITDCYMKMSSDGYALKSDKLDSLSIVTAEVTAQTRTARRSCIDGFRNMTLTAVNASGHEIWNPKTRTLCTPLDSLPVQSTLIQGDLYVGRYIVDVSQTAKEQTITDRSTGLTRGTLKYNGLYQQLTLANATLRVDGTYAIRNTAMRFFGIYVQGADTISATGSDVLHMLCSTTIHGSGRLSSRLVVKGTGSGIYQAGQPLGYGLSISDVDLQVEASAQGIYGQADYSRLAFDNAHVRVRCTTGQSAFKAISGFIACTMTADDSANGTAWRRATGSFDRNDGTTAREVLIDVPTAYYPVIINGHTLNDVNSMEIAAEGIEGAGLAYYDPDLHILTLASIDLSYPEGVAINSDKTGLTINVNGTNAVTADYGMLLNGAARITGPGALNIIATNTGIVGTGQISVDCATLTSRGAFYGFSGQHTGKLSLAAAQRQTATTHIFGGGHGNIIETTDIDLSDMDISSPVCCYIDPETSTIKQNGGRTVTEEVEFRQVTTHYGVSILGVELNNCNVGGVGSPYISSKNFMSFDAPTKTLTLKDFNVENDETMQVIVNECDGLRIRLEGESTLATNAGAVIRINNPDSEGRVETVFCGDGKLNLKGRSFAVLIGNKAGVTFTDHVVVRGEGAIGGNRLGAQEESLTVEESAYVSCVGSFSNPGLEQVATFTLRSPACIVKPNHGKAELLDNGYCVLDKWGVPAHEVILGTPEGIGMYIGETAVTTANYSDVFADGKCCYNPESKTLTLEDAVIDATTGVRSVGIDNQQIEALKIVLVGDNTINARSSAICSEKYVSILGDGKLTATSATGAGLRLYGGDCIINGPTLNIKGNTYAIMGDSWKERMYVTNTNTQLTLLTEGRGTIVGLAELGLGPGLYITSPVDAVFSADDGGLTLDGLLYSGKVVISSREPSAIDPILCDAAVERPAAIYDHSGRQLRHQHRGLNLLRMADGTVRKQLVR